METNIPDAETFGSSIDKMRKAEEFATLIVRFWFTGPHPWGAEGGNSADISNHSLRSEAWRWRGRRHGQRGGLHRRRERGNNTKDQG